MQKRSALFSILFSIAQISQGLLLHPYQTMQSLVRDKIFVWMAFLPGGWLWLVWLLWSGVISSLMGITLPSFLAYWFIFFCLYWQGLLLYLLIRFWIGFRS